ncbi:hypothetical protein VHUM_01234 [Vanrija humicola]|uniref:Enoyl reductase (ER) domain-containing protein n=1 Tax=Vanrija humicola TaxID=5417 RepID=A0A7D8Z5E7_VANHU|nr:hypothetical protein VHUM_01234 [Vanrija humicola]
MTVDTATTQKALVLITAERDVALLEIPVPKPGPGEVLVKVHAIALNPVDSLYVGSPLAQQETRVIGTDFAGVVVSAGDDLAASDDARTKAVPLTPACSRNERPGAFAEYVVVPYDLTWTVPASMSLASASAVSMCGVTAAQGVFFRQQLPAPFWPTKGWNAGRGWNPAIPADEPVNYLIYGATTSLGLYAAQLMRAAAACSGRKVRLIGVASKGKHAFLRAAPYSYDVLVDYRGDWAPEVRAAAPRGIDYAFDAISEGDTVRKVHDLLADTDRSDLMPKAPGVWGSVGYRVGPVYGAAWEALGVEIGYDSQTIPAKPDARAFAAAFYNWLGTAAADGKVKVEPNPARVMPGGLERVVPDGFVLLGWNQVSARDNNGRTEEYMRPISGEKLVYELVKE